MLLCFNPYDHENFNTFQLVYFTMKFGSSIVTKRFASGNLAMKKKDVWPTCCLQYLVQLPKQTLNFSCSAQVNDFLSPCSFH